jgi:hypothetical protein
MGLAALIRPAVIWAPFGASPTTPAARNEVRAVYGGFGCALAVLLVVADRSGAGFRDGVLIAVAVALAGMAGGRIISFVVEPRSFSRVTAAFGLLEILLSLALAEAAVPILA